MRVKDSRWIGPSSSRRDVTFNWSVTATAIDSDIPTNTLAFSLVSPPVGASIDAGNGRFDWRPPVALAGTTNVVQVQVTDYNPLAVNVPRLSDTKSFTVVVNPLRPVGLTPIGYTNGQFQMEISGPIGPDSILQASLTLTNWSDLWTTTPAALPFSFTDTNVNLFGGRFYRALLGL